MNLKNKKNSLLFVVQAVIVVSVEVTNDLLAISFRKVHDSVLPKQFEFQSLLQKVVNFS